MKYAGRFYFVSAHERVLQAHKNGEMHASQKVQSIGEEERWNVYVFENGKMALQNYATNLWLCADVSGEAICNRPKPDAYEFWLLHGVEGRVAFQSDATRKWLTAQPPDENTQWGGEVAANRDVCDRWEQFTMIPADGIKEVNQNWWNDVKSAADVAQQVVRIAVVVAG